MRNNRGYTRILTTLVIALILTCVSATAAYANSDEAAGGAEPEATSEPAVTEPPEPEEPVTPVPLTPDGNLTLVDDISGEQAKDKQFVTVITKNGNYFYLVIDRAGDTENVYFLNLVDESDLLALIEEAPTTQPAVTEPPEATEIEPVEPEPAPEPKDSKMGAILGLIVVLALIGGGAFFYLKVLKPKKGAAKGVRADDFDGFDFDDDEADELPYAADDEPVGYTAEPDGYGADGYVDSDSGTDDEPETEEMK